VKIRNQPRVMSTRFPRIAKSAALRYRVAKEVDKMAERFGCSRAFVMDTALADALGLDTESDERAFQKEK